MEDSKKILKIIENLKLQMQEQKCIYRWLEDGTIDKVVCKFNAPIELEELQKIYQKYPNIKLPESYIAFLKCSNGAQLYEKDVMVLDEPEIHLHPEWQLIYAELIVLLEKYLHLTILITTHSPYFLEAIETYTKKHNVDHITNYYLAQADGKETVMKDVTENLQSVYQLLAKPFEKLESIQMSK